MARKIGKNIIESQDLKNSSAWNYVLEFGIIAAFWLFVALIFTPQTYLVNQRSPTPLSFTQSLAATVIPFSVWALLTPFVLWLGRIFPFEGRLLIRNFPVMFASGVFFSGLQIVLVKVINDLFLSWADDYRPPVPVLALVVGYGATNFLIFWGIVAVSQAINYFRRYQERELRLAQSQLQVLKNQLHPHFLFNTLNAISELTYDAPELADQTLTKLSDLLRLSLESERKQETTLRRELDFLRKYLEIHKVLLQERLRVEFEVEPKALSACVPNMILQPLVENSIRHGINLRENGGEILIRARKNNGDLVLEVEDDNDGFEPQEFKEGLGLSNTRQRLAHLYPSEHQFEITKSPTGGVNVTIVIPFRENQEKEEDYVFLQ